MDGADGARSLGVADNRRRTRCRWGKFQHRSCERSPVPYHALPIFVNTLWIPTIVPALSCCTKKQETAIMFWPIDPQNPAFLLVQPELQHPNDPNRNVVSLGIEIPKNLSGRNIIVQ